MARSTLRSLLAFLLLLALPSSAAAARVVARADRGDDPPAAPSTDTDTDRAAAADRPRSSWWGCTHCMYTAGLASGGGALGARRLRGCVGRGACKPGAAVDLRAAYPRGGGYPSREEVNKLSVAWISCLTSVEGVRQQWERARARGGEPRAEVAGSSALGVCRGRDLCPAWAARDYADMFGGGYAPAGYIAAVRAAFSLTDASPKFGMLSG